LYFFVVCESLTRGNLK